MNKIWLAIAGAAAVALASCHGENDGKEKTKADNDVTKQAAVPKASNEGTAAPPARSPEPPASEAVDKIGLPKVINEGVAAKKSAKEPSPEPPATKDARPSKRAAGSHDQESPLLPW